MNNDSAQSQVVYPQLSYQLIGCAFNVFNNLGFGLSEKTYQKAFAQELDTLGIVYVRERMVLLHYQGVPLAKFFLDFDIDNKVVIELKVRPRLGYVNIKQAIEYLKVTGYKLGILIYFTKDGVKYRRVLNVR